MKLRLTKPLPQPEYGRVIPAGVVIDAPPALCARLQREGRAVWVEPPAGEKRQGNPPTPAALPFTAPRSKREGKK